LIYAAISSIHPCNAPPHPRQRGSFISSHAKIVGSSLYITPLYALTRVSSARALALYIRLLAGSEKNEDLEPDEVGVPKKREPPFRLANSADQSRY